MKVLILPSRIDTLIADCASWTDFRDLASRQKNKDKGDLFERLTQIYLQTHPTYRSKIKNVWWCNNGELPEEVRRKLNLPKTDEGIDLLCETYENEYWSVQSKYQTNSDRPLNYKKLSTFLGLSFVTGKGISTGLVVHTSTKKVKKSHLMGNTVELGLQHWLEITDGQWDQILDVCRGNLLKPPEKRSPRKYQKLAIEKAKEHFLKKRNSRGKIIMPCGTGKSLIAYWSTQVLMAKTVIVAVPSLALVKQSLEDWTSEYLAEGVQPEWMAVCSDDSVGKMREADSTVATVYEAGIPTTTDPTEIVNFIRKKSKNPKVIFTTYQSSPKLADACKQAGLTIDLLIADEAHKMVGRKDKKFATLLSDKNIKIKKRMFMTATERVYRQGSENIASMDDESVFGKLFHQMSFKQAIDDGIICDYKILTVAVSGSEVANLMAEHTDVIAQLGNQKVETDAHNLAAGIAIEKVFEKHKIKHALSFHRSIKRAEDFNKQQDAFSGKLGSKLLIENRNISSKLSAGQRSQLLTDFTASERSLISNARCLTEGVDIPSIDCVAFVDPKQSTVDIVQAAGRAMRQSKATGKTHGYILIPIIVPDGQDLDQFAQSTDFAAVARIITSLSTQDERIAEQLRSKEPRKPSNQDDIIIIDPDIAEVLDIGYEKFFTVLNTKIWKSVGAANWRSFEEARAFVQGKNLLRTHDWHEFSKSELRPPDIPSNPNVQYKDKGWQGFPDWLGSGFIPVKERTYRPFSEARAFVRKLNLKKQKDWKKYMGSGNCPSDIPSNPNLVYSREWLGYGDWLGTGRVRDKIWLDFEEARKLVRALGLQSATDYRYYSKVGKLPEGIPANPEKVYKDDLWSGFGDFLGTGTIAPNYRKYLPFEEARAFAKALNLPNSSAWFEYAKHNGLPDNIPAVPAKVYKHDGWLGFEHWLGKSSWPKDLEHSRPFEEARKFVRNLKLKNSTEWRRFIKSGQKPEDIPAYPDRVYKDVGWVGIPDWLGVYNVAKGYKKWLPFEEARNLVHSLGLSSVKEWRLYTKSGSFDERLPKDPSKAYLQTGWKGFGDWLGTGTIAAQLKVYPPFEEARAVAVSLGLKSVKEWRSYKNSGSFDVRLPKAPDQVYKNKGWDGYNFWLGIGPPTSQTGWRSFQSARQFVHALGLQSERGEGGWRQWAQSEERPPDIPYSPEKVYKDRGWKGMNDWLGKKAGR